MNSSTLLNAPHWQKAVEAKGLAATAFQEVWYMKLNDPAQGRAVWLRFTLMMSANGFRRIAETWAVYFQRNAGHEVSKLAVKQTHDIQAFSKIGEDGIQIGDCQFTSEGTRGSILSKGHSIKWDLQIRTRTMGSFNLVPDPIGKSGLVKNSVVTVGEDLLFTGTTEVDGQKQEWKDAPGMQGHLSGPRNGHSWTWGHCNAFLNNKGQPASFLFEGLSARAALGPIPAPKISSFYFHYQGTPHCFNTLNSPFTLKSQNTLTEWNFHAERGDLTFRGMAKAEIKDFAGLTYEDTNGSYLYCANSKLSDMQVVVYRNGRLEEAFYANGTAAFEVVSRVKNPYVPLLI